MSQEKIEGFYDGKAKRFHPNVNLTHDPDLFYECDPFKEGHAVVHKIQKKSGRHLSGVIDTSGKVIVPFIYDDLEWELFGRSHYFLFYAGDSIGVVTVSGKELLKYKRNWSKNLSGCGKRCFDQQGETGTFLTYKRNADQEFVTVKMNSKIGLYSLDQKRFVIPVEYDCEMRESWPCELCREGGGDIAVTDHYAVCKKNGMKNAYDLTTGEKSDVYEDIIVLKSNEVYLRTKEGKGMLVNDVIHPRNLLQYEVLESFNNYILVKADNKMGMMNSNKEMKIPLEYDDIYFLDGRYLWVKKNGWWAISDDEGNLKTAFEFMNIQYLNTGYFNSLLYCTKLDTTGGTMYTKNYSPGIFGLENTIKALARKSLKNKDSRITFSASPDRDGSRSYNTETYAQKADGFHRITCDETSVKIAEESWDAIHYLPLTSNGFRGYKKGNKYGLKTTEVNYEAILFDANPIEYTTNEKRVRKGYIYGNLRYSPKDKWEKEGKYDDYILK